jgi:hypothetical protein
MKEGRKEGRKEGLSHMNEWRHRDMSMRIVEWW